MSKRYRKILICLFWLGIWFGLALAVNNKILLASPVETLKALVALLGKGSFYLTVAGSLLRIGAGFAMGFAVAVFLAGASYRFGTVEELLAPFVNLLKTIPVASFVVLLLIWWGSEFLSVAISFLVVFPNIYVNTLEGLKNADRQLLEMAQVFRMPMWNQFFYIYRPALKPFLYSGLKISLGMCWKSGVAAEVIGTPDYSIGERLYLSKVYIDTAELFAWTAVIVLLSTMFEKIVMWLVERFFVWEPACREADLSKKGGPKVRRGTRGILFGENCAEKQESRGGKQERTAEKKESGAEKKESSVGKQRLQLEAVTKCYNGQPVLDHISEIYQPGRTYYLTSPSGSGKTTLLRVLAGLTEPDEGVVHATGSCSMVFQEDRLCEEYSAVKNVELVLGTGGKAGKDAEYALRKLLPEEALHKPCRELSGGMKRRVALVRAMEADSDFVLLDEPFTGMDAETRKQAEAYIKERQNGRILMIATHI